MSGEEGNNHHGVRALEVFADSLARDHSMVSEFNRGSASRLVWFVAIAGFGFLNIRSYAESVISQGIDTTYQILLSLPWSFTAIFGIISHWLLGELMARDNDFFMLRQHAIRSFLATAEKEPATSDVLSIIRVDETDQDVAERKRERDSLFPWVQWSERITFALLLLAFLWSAVFPLLVDSE